MGGWVLTGGWLVVCRQLVGWLGGWVSTGGWLVLCRQFVGGWLVACLVGWLFAGSLLVIGWLLACLVGWFPFPCCIKHVFPLSLGHDAHGFPVASNYNNLHNACAKTDCKAHAHDCKAVDSRACLRFRTLLQALLCHLHFTYIGFERTVRLCFLVFVNAPFF